MWLSIYDRVAQHAPELMAADGESAGDSKRGKEKRRLLAYLQQHPEELRPVLRRANGKKFNSKRPTQARSQRGARR
jgi:hypothetical protein